MEASASRSSRGFDEEDDDDQEFARREGSSFHKDLAIKVDGKGSGTDDLPTTPRSKHSAMEQRRRNKINDRFRMLRELVPHNDQKRDKASLLLEVIEYIRYLQEKVQKYESSYPGSDQENANIMPWVKVYYRSFWKNSQTNNQSPLDGLADPPQVIRNGSAPAFSGQFDEGNIPVGPAMLSNSQNPTESDTTAGIICKMENATGFVNISSQAQSHWLGSSSPADCAVSSEMLNEQEDLIIDEGTINASATYSKGLLTTLTQALQSSGVDLSQANISVQINLGKRATNKRSAATVTLCNSKGSDNPSTNQVVDNTIMGNATEESSQASKRQSRI